MALGDSILRIQILKNGEKKDQMMKRVSDSKINGIWINRSQTDTLQRKQQVNKS